MILAHELTHALDDQYIDLGGLMRPGIGTEDTDFVATAIGEGSATSLMLQHMFAAQKSGRFSLSDLSQYVTEELAQARTLEQLPRYFSAMFGSYVVGAAFLAKGELTTVLTQADNRAIGEALLVARRALPRSSEQVLHADKYWDATRRDVRWRVLGPRAGSRFACFFASSRRMRTRTGRSGPRRPGSTSATEPNRNEHDECDEAEAQQ
jgi:hypothetical protein